MKRILLEGKQGKRGVLTILLILFLALLISGKPSPEAKKAFKDKYAGKEFTSTTNLTGKVGFAARTMEIPKWSRITIVGLDPFQAGIISIIYIDQYNKAQYINLSCPEHKDLLEWANETFSPGAPKISVVVIEPTTCQNLKCSFSEGWNITFMPLDVSSTGIAFSLQNTGKEPILIIWDESALIDMKGQSSRIIHSGIRLMEKEAPQAPSVIAPGTSISDEAAPSSNIHSVSIESGGWKTDPLFSPSFIVFDKGLEGQTLGLYLVLKVGEKKQPQKFNFRLGSVSLGTSDK